MFSGGLPRNRAYALFRPLGTRRIAPKLFGSHGQRPGFQGSNEVRTSLRIRFQLKNVNDGLDLAQTQGSHEVPVTRRQVSRVESAVIR